MVKFTPAKHMQKLKKLRLDSEEVLVEVYAKKAGIGYIDLTMRPINTDALKLVPQERALAAGIASFDLIGRKIYLAVRSPLPTLVQEEIKKLKEKKYQVFVYMASKKSIERA
jgi:hypothetical protein